MARTRRYESATSIDAANYCKMRYFLTYVERVPTENKSVFVSGQVLHALAEHFWDKLGTKYSTVEQFCEHASKQFMYRVIKDQARAIDLLVAMESSLIPENPEKRVNLEGRLTKKGREELNKILGNRAKLEKKIYKLTKSRIKKLNKELIVWRDENDRWIIKDRVTKSAVLIYDWLMEEGKPFAVEIGFNFMLNGIRYRGFIDRIDIRGGHPLITDYKTGSKPVMRDMKLRKDPQMTFYGLGLAAGAYSDPEFAEAIGLDGEAKLLMGNPMFLSDKFRYRYVEIGRDEIKVSETSRTDNDCHQLIAMIKGIRKAVIEGEIYPEWGRKCDYCPVSQSCLEKTNKNYETVNPGENHFFSFMVPPYAKKPVEVAANPSIKQKKFRFSRRKKS